MVEIIEGIKIVDLCLYIPESQVLILGDVHFGFEESLNKQGILVPRFQFEDVMKKIESVLDSVKVRTVVFNGDIKHEFGNISKTEWRHSLKLLDLLLKYSKEIVFVKGNHDTVLGPIAEKRNVKVVNHYYLDRIYVCHGHEVPVDEDFEKAQVVVIGHEHPAVGLYKDGRVETFKCFLRGIYKNKRLLVMPSFNQVTEGTDLLKEKLLSPFLNRADLDKFKVYVVNESQVYTFGHLSNLRKL